MTPTAYLRFVERLVDGEDKTRTVRILQQWWTHGCGEITFGGPDGFKGEWVDVPMGVE